MNKAHKHAAVIKAWADGAEIEQRDPNVMLTSMPPQPDRWRAFSGNWDDRYDYRVKPEPPVKVYPTTGLSGTQIGRLVRDVFGRQDHGLQTYHDFANAALRHAIDARQVVVPDGTALYSYQANKYLSNPIVLDSLERRNARDLAIAEAVLTEARRLALATLAPYGVMLDTFNLDLPAIIATVKD